MSDIHLHHDLGHEASSRRAREADGWVRDQSLRRSAKRRASRAGQGGIRLRFIALLARAMGVAEQIATPSTQPTQRPTAHRHTH